MKSAYTLQNKQPEVALFQLHISKKQKGQTLGNGFALTKNDITSFLRP